MSNLNRTDLQGNLVADPELRGNDENPCIAFTIAVNNGFGDKRSTLFMDCFGFGSQAKLIKEHFVKGKQILVTGRLEQSMWETPEGDKRYKIELKLNNYDGFHFVSDARNAQPQEEPELVPSDKPGF